jgi:preprotein translocase subunit SecG
MLNYAYYIVLLLLAITAVLLIGLVLIQKGRGGGLSSAFGGGGGSAAFGAKTGDVLTYLTCGFFAAFILLAVALDLIVNSQYRPMASASAVNPSLGNPVQQPSAASPQPASTAQPPATAPVLPVIPAVNPGAVGPLTVSPGVAPVTATAPSNLTPELTMPIPATSPTNRLNQIIHGATTQATGAVNAATQPIGKLINGAKP